MSMFDDRTADLDVGGTSSVYPFLILPQGTPPEAKTSVKTIAKNLGRHTCQDKMTYLVCYIHCWCLQVISDKRIAVMLGAACYMWWGCGTSSHSSCWRRDQGTHGGTRHPTCFTFTSCLSIFPARTPIWRYGDISQPSHTCVDTGTPPESAINLPLSELLGFYFTFCLVCSIYRVMLGDVVQR